MQNRRKKENLQSEHNDIQYIFLLFVFQAFTKRFVHIFFIL
jgi:hypothetical protein